MGRIRRLFLLARYQGTPTEHVVHLRRGRTVHCGVGLAFWFRPALAAISEVPATDHERPVLFHVATRDQQDVTVQAVLTYRFADPETAARGILFCYQLASTRTVFLNLRGGQGADLCRLEGLVRDHWGDACKRFSKGNIIYTGKLSLSWRRETVVSSQTLSINIFLLLGDRGDVLAGCHG